MSPKKRNSVRFFELVILYLGGGLLETIVVDGIEITLERKKIKNMHLYVKPPYGDVVITAPFRMPRSEIEDFVFAKYNWIIANIEKMQSSPVTPDPEFESGETIRIWGELYTLVVSEGSKYSLELSDDGNAYFTVRPSSTPAQREHYFTEWCRAELTERVDILLPQWEAYTGLSCSGWQSKNMKSRWGTCNTKTKKIWLNTNLVHYPTECLEYIILHELTHTVVPNHGPEFKEILYRYMPDWKSKKQLLKSR